MKRGAGKRKGSAFERQICEKLSLWITQGKKKDCLWRSAMSGGRATAAHKRGEHVRQAGDICSVSEEGHKLCDEYYIECKHYRNLGILNFILHNKGLLAGFWLKARNEAKKHGRKPMLIVKQNNVPVLVIIRHQHWVDLPKYVELIATTRSTAILFLDKLLKEVPYG